MKQYPAEPFVEKQINQTIDGVNLILIGIAIALVLFALFSFNNKRK